MDKTEQNLQEAFAGESQANRKYLAFAARADEEGYKQAARLFRAAAAAETVHALSHLKALGAVKGTKENLQAAHDGEVHEVESMYPPMIEEAKAAGNKQAERSFTYAYEVEKVHAALYKKAIESLKNPVETEYYLCPVCGHTAEAEAPDKCPVCGTKGAKFNKVE